MRRAGWLLLLMTLALSMVGCSSVAPVVKVGLVGPFEGAQREIGYDVIYSARLAVREINAAGGIGGYRVALVALDDGGEAAAARQTAVSLTLDPAIVAVVGHWVPESTAAGASVYAGAGVPLIVAGERPFGIYDPANLPTDFLAAYEGVTPFDEVAGSYAGSAYDAFQLLWVAMAAAEAGHGTIERDGVAEALTSLTHEGVTGPVYVEVP